MLAAERMKTVIDNKRITVFSPLFWPLLLYTKQHRPPEDNRSMDQWRCFDVIVNTRQHPQILTLTGNMK